MTVVDGAADMFCFYLVETDNLTLHVEHILQFTHQFVVVPRLHDKVGSTALQSSDGQRYICISRQQHHRHLRMVLADGAQPEQSLLSAVHAEGEVHVEQHDVNGLLRHRLQDVVRLVQRDDSLESGVQTVAQGCQDRGVVVDYQYASVVVHRSFLSAKLRLSV